MEGNKRDKINNDYTQQTGIIKNKMNGHMIDKNEPFQKPPEVKEEDVKPKVTEEMVPDIVWRLYGLRVQELKQLVSYDDLNFYFRVKEEVDNPNIAEINEDGYVFKVINSSQSTCCGIVDAQHAYLRWLSERGITVHKPIKTREGEHWSLETFTLSNEGKDVQFGPYIVRILTFIPGPTFNQLPFVNGSFFKIGQFLGKLHKASQGFKHTFYDSYVFKWSLLELPNNRKYIDILEGEERALVNEVFALYENTVQPNLAHFTKGVIHGDINEYNIVMHEVPEQEGVPKELRVNDVTAPIDFMDSHTCYNVFEIAICIAHLSSNTTSDQLETGGHILAGYMKHLDLNEHEFAALKALICGRFVQSIVHGAHAIKLQPNNKYVTTGIQESRALLTKLWQMDTDELLAKWRNIIDSYTI